MLSKIYDTNSAKEKNYGLYDYLVDSMNDEHKVKPYGRVDRSRYAFSYNHSSHNYLYGPDYIDIIGEKYCYDFSGDTDKYENVQKVIFNCISKGLDYVELNVFAMATLIDLMDEIKRFKEDYPNWDVEISISESLCADGIDRQTTDFDDCLKQIIAKYKQVKEEYLLKQEQNKEKAKNILKGIKKFKESKKNKKL